MEFGSDNDGSGGEDPRLNLTQVGKGNLETDSWDTSTPRQNAGGLTKSTDNSRLDKEGLSVEQEKQARLGVIFSGDFVKLCWGKMMLFCQRALNFAFECIHVVPLWRAVPPIGPPSPDLTFPGIGDEDPGGDPGDKSTAVKNPAGHSDIGEGNPGLTTSSGDASTYDLSCMDDVASDFPETSTASLRNDVDEEDTDILDVAKLVQLRMEALKQKQLARRASWLEEVNTELEKRSEYKRAMEGIPPNQVEDKDKQKMSNGSCDWRKMFRKQRTRFLFSEIFPIVCKHYYTAITPPKEAQNAALPFLLRGRLVCSFWRGVIDHSVSQIMSKNQLSVKSEVPPCSPILVELDKLREFILWSDHDYRGSGRNPFFSRQFTAGSRAAGEWISNLGYWNEVEKMLGRWGGEIWTLHMMFDKGSLELMYVFLHRVLSLTPNLRKLYLMDRDSFSMIEVDKRKDLRKQELAPLALRIERDPLPDLPQLSTIWFGDGASAPVPLLQAMLAKYGDSLVSLYFFGFGLDKFTGGYVDPGEFAAGRALPLQNYTCQYLSTPQISNWNYQFPSLEYLNLEYMDVEEGAEVGNIFKTVNCCGSTLRRLHLSLNFIRGPNPVEASKWKDRLPPGLKLELPQLEILELTVTMSKITNIDFLLPLVSLKELSFSFDVMKGDNSVKNGKGIIQFAGFRNRLYDSNIWKLLPELGMVTIKVVPIAEQGTKRDRFGRQIQQPKNITVYDRDGYRKHLDIRS